MNVIPKQDVTRVDIDGILQRRGILGSVTRHNWQPQGNRGWQYPVFDLDGQVIGYRLKLLQGHQKYLWSPSKPTHELANWYILPDTAQAIQAAGGICYLANGEPALHAYHSATVYNSIATTLSEIAVPENILMVLQALGVTRLVSIVDNDYAGYLSAIAWRDALRGSGIDFEACTWGKSQANKIHVDTYGKEYPYIACDDVTEKLDGNDIWQQLAFDGTAFRQWLAGVITLPLPAPQEKAQVISTDIPDITEPLAAAIAQALAPHFNGKKHKGWLQHKCVHHDDDRASAGFNPLTGVINCFACGAHSPYETADALGIDWKAMYPKREHAPKTSPKLDDSQLQQYRMESQARLQAVYEADLKHSEDIEEKNDYAALNADVQRFLDGDYRSWWDSDEIPYHVYSALLNLMNTRSETPRVIGLMHRAFKTGRLNWVLFTVADIVDATGLDKRIVSNALDDMQSMSLVQFQSGNYLREILYTETVLNYFSHYPTTGKKPKWYTLNFNLDSIEATLYSQLETKFREKFHKKTYAKRNKAMAYELGIESLDDWRKLERRNEIVMKHDKPSKAAERKLVTEMEGDGTVWFGWRVALENPTTCPIDWSVIDSVKGLRSQLLVYHIQRVSGENTREDLRRLVGGNDSTLQALYEDNYIATKQQFERVDIPADFADLRDTQREQQTKYRGMIRKVSFQYEGVKGWQPQLLDKAAYYYAKDSDKIERVFMLICKPSKQWLMSAEEIAIKQAQEAESESGSDTVAASESQVEKAINAKSPSYQQHDRRFTYQQNRRAVFIFTPYQLVGDVILDDDKNLIYKAQSDCDIELWLNDHAQVRLINKKAETEVIMRLADVQKELPDHMDVKPLRVSIELDGKPYEDTDDATNKVFAEKRLNRIISLVQPKTAQAPKPEQKPLPTPKPKRELTEREKLFMDFWTRRFEREYANQKNHYEWVRKESKSSKVAA